MAFDVPSGTVVEAYVLVERIDSSRSGDVYSAYDPGLDRTVVLWISADPEHAAVAQALAQSPHRNLATVHTVGTFRGHTWLAMEHAQGDPVSVWVAARPRRTGAILEVFAAAAEGLATLHDAGVTQPDFDLDTVLVSSTTMVRLRLVGAVRTVESDDAGDTAPAHPRAVQSRFFAALWSALHLGSSRSRGKQVRVPAWLRRVCERGRSLDGRRPYEDLHAVALALRHGRRLARRRTMWGALGTLAVVGLGGVGAYHHKQQQELAECRMQGNRIDQIWNDDIADEVQRVFGATHVAFVETTAETIIPHLHEYREQWRDAQTQACIDERVHARWDAETSAQVRWCLADQYQAVQALIAALPETTAASATAVTPAVLGLVPPTRCLDATLLATALPVPPLQIRSLVVPLRAQLATVHALDLAGQAERGLVLARQIRRRAQALRWDPLTAQALEQESSLLVDLGAYAEAQARAEQAYDLAFASGQWATAAWSAVHLVFVATVDARADRIHAWGEHAQIAVDLAGPDGGGLASIYALTQGGALVAVGEYRAAEQHLDEAVRLRAALVGAGHPLWATARRELADLQLRMGRAEEAKVSLTEVLAVQRASLGDNHPFVGDTLWGLANHAEQQYRFEDGLAFDRQALAILEPALGAEHPRIGTLLRNTAVECIALRKFDEAEALLDRALTIVQATSLGDSSEVATTLRAMGRLATAQGDDDKAEVLFRRALAIYDAQAGSKDLLVASTITDLTELLFRKGALAEALAYQRREISINAARLGPDHAEVGIGIGYRAWTKYKLGDLDGAHDDITRALSIVETALGSDQLGVAQVLQIMTDIESERGDFVVAEHAARRALGIEELIFGPDHPRVATVLVSLADVLVGRGDPMQALVPLRRGMAILQAVEGTQSNETHGHWRMATTLTAAGQDPAEARRHAIMARDGWLAVGSTELADEVSAWLEGSPSRRAKP